MSASPPLANSNLKPKRRWNQTVVPFQNGAVVFRKRFFISRVGFEVCNKMWTSWVFLEKPLASWNPMTPGSIFFTYTCSMQKDKYILVQWLQKNVYSKICFHHTVIPITHNYRWGLGRSLSPLRLASLSAQQKNGWNNPHFLTPSQTYRYVNPPVGSEILSPLNPQKKTWALKFETQTEGPNWIQIASVQLDNATSPRLSLNSERFSASDVWTGSGLAINSCSASSVKPPKWANWIWSDHRKIVWFYPFWPLNPPFRHGFFFGVIPTILHKTVTWVICFL